MATCRRGCAGARVGAPEQSGLEERVARLEEAVRALEERLAGPSWAGSRLTGLALAR